MHSFLAFIQAVTPFSDESRDAFAAVSQRMEFPKGYSLLRPGAICHYLYFIEKGLTRTYYLKDGKDVTDWISAEGSIAVSLISFISRQPDRRGIELLEDSILHAVSHTHLEELY